MKMFNNILILIALICLTETMAISCVKKYHNGDGSVFFIFAILLYSVVCFLLNKSFYLNTMGITNVLWSGVSVLFVIMAGVFLFHEKIHTHDLVGGALITAGMLMIRYTK
jgi:small multidrug resistance pump